MNIDEFRNWLDSCRPGHDDLAEPEFTALVAAMQQDPQLQRHWAMVKDWDVAIQAAMHKVAVPEGLDSRIMAAVTQADREMPKSEAMKGPEKSEEAVVGATAARQRWLTPWPAMITAGVCAAAVLIALGVWFGRGGERLTGPHLAELARDWIVELDKESWNSGRLPPSGFTLDPSLRFPALGWQRFSAFGRDPGVAYFGEIAPDRAAAFLMVIQTRRGAQLPSSPPSSPDSTTEGICIGAWRNQDLLYVLLVTGPEASYHGVLRTHRLPIG